MTQVITRSVEVRSVDLEERTITGLAVPYGQVVDIPAEGIKESFVRGVFEGSTDVKLFNEHREIIGLVTKGADTDAGYEITARISNTRAGNDVYELLKDEALKNFSVGFIPVKDRNEDGVVVRTQALLKEVSVVAFPAYDGARISQVRRGEEINSKEDNMSEDIKEVLSRVANLESANEELERRLAVAGESNTKDEAPKFRTAGEFVKALADGKSEAKDEAAKLDRVYGGSVIANSHAANDWKTDLLTIVQQERNIINLFNRAPLGASGMNVEYAKINAVTGAVAEQALEGDTLSLLKVTTTSATAPVKTYGVYSDLSRQVVERSDIPFLQLTLEAQAQSWAKVTNDVVRAAVVAATPQTGASLTLATAKGKDWMSAVMDGVKKIKQNAQGAKAEFILVSWDVWLQIATLADTTDRPLFNINGDGSNTLGTANGATGVVGRILDLPVAVDYDLAAKTMYIASSRAVTTFEASGVPFRLDDESPLTLTKVYSIYGYMAVGVRNALALVKPTIA
jgi:hypothetical protein